MVRCVSHICWYTVFSLTTWCSNYMWKVQQQCACLRGWRKRSHPSPPSWPAEMSGRSQGKRKIQQQVFRLLQMCQFVLLPTENKMQQCDLWRQQNVLSSQACRVALEGVHHRLAANVWEVMPHVHTWVWLRVLESISILCVYLCVSKWKHSPVCALIW